MNAIVSEMVNAAQNAIDTLKERITNVRIGPIIGSVETIYFSLDNVPMHGVLRGRNRNLVLTGNIDQDRAIACRVLLDGDAVMF